MDEPQIFAADAAAVRIAAAVLRQVRDDATPPPPRRAMTRPETLGAPRRSRQVLPRPPIRARRGR